MPAFYCPDFTQNSPRTVLAGEEFHHLTHVMRKQSGQNILLTNGTGLLAQAVIVKIGKKHAELDILSIEEKKAGVPRIAIAFSLLRNKHDHMIVEKLTELGFKEFFPFMSDFTVRKDSGNAVAKFEAVSVAALKQCDGAYLPTIHPIMEFKETVQYLQNSGYIPLVASEWRPMSNRCTLVDGEHDVCLVIGTEGGFSDDERNWISDRNIETFTLGNHIVRAETAAIAAAGQLTGILIAKDPSFY